MQIDMKERLCFMKRTLFLALALVLAMSFIPFTHAESYETLPITMFNYTFSKSPLGTPVMDAYLEKLEKFANEELGMTLEITWEEQNLWDWLAIASVYVASGEWPDVFTLWNKTDAHNLGVQDMIVDLTDYVDDMPNFKKYIEADPFGYEALLASENGRLYFLPCTSVVNNRSDISNFYARFDTIKEHGLTPPQTMEELIDVCRQYKEIYPDSYPLASMTNIINIALNWMNTDPTIYYNGEEFVFGPIADEENTKAAIEWLADAYAEGLIDPEYEIVTREQRTTKMLDGTYFFMMQQYTDNIIPVNGSEIYPDVEWGGLKQPLNLNGEVSWEPASHKLGESIQRDGNGLIVINKKCEYAEEIIKLLDYARYSDEMVELCAWGIEGVTFVKDANGNNIYVDEIMTAVDPQTALAEFGLGNSVRSGVQIMPQVSSATSGAMGYIPCYDDGEYTYEVYSVFYDRVNPEECMKPWSKSDAPAPSFSADEQNLISSIKTPVETYVNENLAKFVNGELDIDEDWEAFIGGIYDMGDIDSLVELYNSKIN